MVISIMNILADILAISLGIDIKSLKSILRKKQTQATDNINISNDFDDVVQKLQDSKAIIDQALQQVENQRKIADELRKEAETSMQIKSMNADQLQAVSILLEKSISKNDKSTLKRNIIINTIFCIISAGLGFLVAKI
jgi:hypothetical protein